MSYLDVFRGLRHEDASLFAAAEQNYQPAVPFNEHAVPFIDFHEDANIFEAAEKNDQKAVHSYIEEEGVLPNTTDIKDRTAAHIASMYGHLDIVKYLLEKDPTVLALEDISGHTVLVKAILYGRLHLVTYLVENYPSNITERLSPKHGGNTAIHYAAGNCRLDILKYFMEERKADVNVENDLEETPVFIAAEAKFQHMPIIKYLHEDKNADLLKIDTFGKNILYKAVENNDLDLMRYILDERGIQLDLNWRDHCGNALVHRAVTLNRLIILDYLLTVKRVDVEVPNNSGDTPLHIAAHKNNIDMCRRLIESGNASTTSKDEKGRLPQHRAKQKHVISYLEGVSHKRTRRNVSPSRRQSRSTTLGDWILKKIDAPGPFMTQISDGGVNTNNMLPSFSNVFSFQFQTIFTIAYLFLSERSERYSWRTNSRVAISENVDPFIIDAIHEIPEFHAN